MRSAALGVPGLDVGRIPANWTSVATVAPGASLIGQTFDCSTLPAGQDLFYAIQVQYDTTFFGDYVGRSTQVKCNSTLADPNFKVIGKKNKK